MITLRSVGLYKEFLITQLPDETYKAYRSLLYFDSDCPAHTASTHDALISMIDEEGNDGNFTSEDYIRLGSRVTLEEYGPSEKLRDEGIERAAAYIAGLIVGREDVDDPSHPVWLHLEEQYKESYRRRARRVIELSKP